MWRGWRRQPGMPLNLEPEMNRQIERVLILALTGLGQCQFHECHGKRALEHRFIGEDQYTLDLSFHFRLQGSSAGSR